MKENTVARWQAVARESAPKSHAENTALVGRMLHPAEEAEGNE